MNILLDISVSPNDRKPSTLTFSARTYRCKHDPKGAVGELFASFVMREHSDEHHITPLKQIQSRMHHLTTATALLGWIRQQVRTAILARANHKISD